MSAEFFIDHQEARPELVTRTDRFIGQAKEDALSRLPDGSDKEARKRVETSIERRLKPYVEEGQTIAEQISSPEYQDFIRGIGSFLKTRPGGVQCSDGRILSVAIFDPMVGILHKRPQGLPETRESTLNGTPVLDDQRIAASINTTIKKRIRQGKNAEIIEFLGPHIDSVHPDHGCGAAKGKAAEGGNPSGTSMQHGGIEMYFDELGRSFEAFNTDIERAGGKGTSFDMVHDSHSQGLIFGLREAHQKGWLNKDKSLRENLEELHNGGKILMTELLDEKLQGDIWLAKGQMGIDQDETLDIRNPNHFAENMIRIGEMAKTITERYENSEKGFSFIPEHLTEGKSDNAVRTLAYTAIRNSVYRNLADIRPGAHDFREHPEQLVRVGPIGPAFNTDSVGFVQVTPHGGLREQDEVGVDKLYGLAEIYMPQLHGDRKADFEKEGRVILVTGEYDKSRYADEDARIEAFEQTASDVRINAAKLRKTYKKGVVNGNTIVVSAIYESHTRELTHILTSSPQKDRL